MSRFKTGHTPSSTDSVTTPKYVMDYLKKRFQVNEFYDPTPFNKDFDPKLNRDALTTDWGVVTFCNPPYSNVRSFVKKAHEQWKKGKTVIMLIKLDNLGTRYFKDYGVGSEIIILSRKITFGGYNGTPRFSSVLVLFHKDRVVNIYSVVDLKESVVTK